MTPAPSGRNRAGPTPTESAPSTLHDPAEERSLRLATSLISKSYGGVPALQEISVDFAAGEIHAIVGENGAGKSTFIKILSGIIQPDGGTMTLDGAAYAPASPSEAMARGIRVVHQEFSLLPSLSIAENLLFERLPRRFGIFVDTPVLMRRAQELLALVGLEGLDPRLQVGTLGVAQQQLIEIARALADDARVLILDEPTATLTPRESGRLFEIVHRLKAQGTTVLFISHHLEEVFAHCDRVTVFRNGRMIVTQETGAVSADGLVQQMVGRELRQERLARPARAGGRPALEIDGFQTALNAARPDISLTLRAGEILGIAGLVGAGRSELLRAIFGADLPARGLMLRDGRPVTVASPRDAIAAGISLVTENRKEEGLVLPMSLTVNGSLATVHEHSRAGFLDRGAENRTVSAMLRSLDIRAAGFDLPVASLSGGNQQKVVLAKWLLRKPGVLMLDEPTRGIDVGAKAEIYALLAKLAEEGVAILVVSSDIPELLTLADRVEVMSRGVIAGSLEGEAMTEEAILQLAYSEYLKEQVSHEH